MNARVVAIVAVLIVLSIVATPVCALVAVAGYYIGRYSVRVCRSVRMIK